VVLFVDCRTDTSGTLTATEDLPGSRNDISPNSATEMERDRGHGIRLEEGDRDDGSKADILPNCDGPAMGLRWATMRAPMLWR